jgi:hypothetical protein
MVLVTLPLNVNLRMPLRGGGSTSPAEESVSKKEDEGRQKVIPFSPYTITGIFEYNSASSLVS